MRKYFIVFFLLMLILEIVRCKNGLPAGDPGNGGLMLPGGSEALL
jgi:hypothetical protein